MNDRDRLATDLYNVSVEAYGQRRWAQAPWPTDLYGFVADRLIALGWTRLDDEDGHRHSDLWCERCVEHGIAIAPEAPLDEERLARALHLWFCGNKPHGDKGRPIIGWACQRGAAAIAKAYREDTDA